MSEEKNGKKQFGALAERESPFDEKLTTSITTTFDISKEQANVAMQTLLKKNERSLPNLAIALSYCKQLGVNPLSVGGGVWFVEMRNQLTCLIHYGAMKGIAKRTGELWSCKTVSIYAGEEFKFDPFTGEFAYKADHTKRTGKPIGAVSVVIRAKTKEEAAEARNKYVVYAPFGTYCKSGKDDSAWQSSPEPMIEKAALRRALKDAFAAELFGVYTQDEFIDVTAIETPKTKGRSSQPEYLQEEESETKLSYELIVEHGKVKLGGEPFTHEALKALEGQTVYVKKNDGVWFASLPGGNEVPLKQYKKRGRPKKKEAPQEPVVETVKRQSEPDPKSEPVTTEAIAEKPDDKVLSDLFGEK